MSVFRSNLITFTLIYGKFNKHDSDTVNRNYTLYDKVTFNFGLLSLIRFNSEDLINWLFVRAHVLPRLVSVVTSWSCQCSTKEASWWPASTWLWESFHHFSYTPSGWASVSQVTPTHAHTHNVHACALSYFVWICIYILSFYMYHVFRHHYSNNMGFLSSVWCTGLSSFYSELMRGFGAGGRLWELLDRKPEFPLNGQYTDVHSHRQESSLFTSMSTVLSWKHPQRLTIIYVSRKTNNIWCRIVSEL